MHTLLSLILLLSLAAPPPLAPAQRHAAQVAAGESPIALMGVAGYVGVLCTMINRVADPRFPGDLAAVVKAGYFAPPRPLTAQERDIAADILTGQAECDQPYLYVLSGPDVARLNLPPAPWIVQGKGNLSLHFYVEWPEEIK